MAKKKTVPTPQTALDTVAPFVPSTIFSIVGDPSAFAPTLINEYSVMGIPAWYSGVRFISETMATFDIAVHKDDGIDRARIKHPLNILLTRKINDYATPAKTLETWFFHAANYGNGYLWKKKNSLGKTIALDNLNPESVIPFLFEGEKYYYILGPESFVLTDDDVIHLFGVSLDGIRGIPPVHFLKGSLEVGKYAERHSANFFKRGSFVKGTVEFPGPLTDPQMQTIRNSLAKFKGVDAVEAMQFAILPFGGKMNNLTSPNETGQLIETRRWSVIEICQILRLPPHILYELSHGKWSSVQQMGDEVVKYSLQWWITSAQQLLSSRLLTEQEQQDGLYIRYHTESLQTADRGLMETQTMQLVNAGIITPNEGRRRLELPSLGPAGDILRIPTGGAFATGQSAIAPTVPGPSVADNGDDVDGTVVPASGPGNDDDDSADEDQKEQVIESTLPIGPVAMLPGAAGPAYSAIIEPVLLEACNRIENKTEKAFANKKAKVSDDARQIWAAVFAGEQGRDIKEVFGPIQKIGELFGKSIDIDAIASRYEAEINRLAVEGKKESLHAISKEIVYGNSKAI